MKKKFLLIGITIVLILVSMVSFMGCSGNNIYLTKNFPDTEVYKAAFNNYNTETLTYTMKDSNNNSIGTFTTEASKMTGTCYLNKDGECEEKDAEYTLSKMGTTCYVYKTTLTVNGNVVKKTIAYCKNDLLMIGSYSYTNYDSTETVVISSNKDDSKYNFKKYVNGEKVAENSIKNGKYESSAYYDNTMTFLVARNMPNDSNYASFSYNYFNLDNLSKTKVSVINSTDSTNVPDYKEGTCSGRKVTLSTTDSVLGKTNEITVYLSTTELDYVNNSKIQSPILEITEGNYKYILDM